jgi:hypothetical protein
MHTVLSQSHVRHFASEFFNQKIIDERFPLLQIFHAFFVCQENRVLSKGSKISQFLWLSCANSHGLEAFNFLETVCLTVIRIRGGAQMRHSSVRPHWTGSGDSQAINAFSKTQADRTVAEHTEGFALEDGGLAFGTALVERGASVSN